MSLHVATEDDARTARLATYIVTAGRAAYERVFVADLAGDDYVLGTALSRLDNRQIRGASLYAVLKGENRLAQILADEDHRREPDLTNDNGPGASDAEAV